MLNSRFVETIQMTWRTGDSYIDGRFVAGKSKSESVVGSVQRLDMRARQLLPEGFRERETFKFFTEIDLVKLIDNDVDQIVDSAQFLYKGKYYVMLASEHWDYIIPHWKITFVERTKGTDNG